MNDHVHAETPLRQLSRLGQSVWIDWLSRDLLASGELQRLIAEHAVVGVTTNPTILERAITAGGAYERQIRDLRAFGFSPAEAFGEIAATDVSSAAVQLLPVWQATGGADGYVSWEVDPALAWNASATLSEVRRLHRRIDLPNLLVKIPATDPGLAAIEDSIAAGYSINVTLIFSVERYTAVVEAYLRGLRRAADAGRDLGHIHSVASFFISRLDTAADSLLENDASPAALALRGRFGIASAKLAYQHFQEAFSGPGWEALSAHGAAPQRPLWASTSTKDPTYRDVRYVEELIGPHTITTLPAATLSAFEDHGQVEESLTRGVDDAARTLRELAEVGVDLESLTAELERDGVAQFAQSLDAVVRHIGSRGDRTLVRSSRVESRGRGGRA
jgi:transaldolase